MSEIINILLAEDEPTLAMIIKDTLDGQGFVVNVAGDGEEALRLYAASKPDVIVADVMMPRLDGYELVRRIRKHDAHSVRMVTVIHKNVLFITLLFVPHTMSGIGLHFVTGGGVEPPPACGLSECQLRCPKRTPNDLWLRQNLNAFWQMMMG